MLFVLSLHHIPDGQGSNIAAVLEVPGVQRISTNLVKDFSRLGPGREHAGGSSHLGTRDKFVLVVLFGAPNNSVLYNFLNNMGYLSLRKWEIHDESHPILSRVFFARCQTGWPPGKTRGQHYSQNGNPRAPEAVKKAPRTSRWDGLNKKS